jgi:steroid delta-isomerase
MAGGGTLVPRERIVELCDAYLRAVRAQDGVATAELFASDATVEDPIGSPPRRGREIVAFYSIPRSIEHVTRIGPVTVSGSTAAFQFQIRLVPSRQLTDAPAGSPIDVVITDVLTFDTEGHICSMVGIPDSLAAQP